MSAPATQLPIAGYRDSFRYLGRQLRGRAVPITVVVLAGIITAVAGLAGPWVIGGLVDELRADPSAAAVWRGAVIVVVAGIVLGLGTWIGRAVLARVTEPAVSRLREDVMSRALELDSGTVERTGTGDLVSRVADDSRKISESTEQILPLFLQSVFVVVISAIGLTALDWRLGLVGLVAVPMYYLTIAWYLPRGEPMYRAERAAFGRRAGRLLSSLTGRDTLRAYRKQQVELERIHSASTEARDLSIGVFRFLTSAMSRNNRAEAVVLSCIIIAGFALVWFDETTAGAVTTAALVYHRLFNPIGAIVGLFDEMLSAGASLTRMVGVIQASTAAVETAQSSGAACAARGSDAASGPNSGIALSSVEFTYPAAGDEDDAHEPVLHGVDLEVPPGTVIAVVGTTGSGKTTMAKIAAGILTPSTGSARFGERQLSDFAEPELRAHVCMVSQEVHTFVGTVRDNVALAKPEADAAEVEDALRAVGADFAFSLPEGLDTDIGDGGHRLSPLEDQLLALARVQLADPDLVVLDEATAEAGSSGARALETAAAKVLDGRAGLVVAHRLNQAHRADRILVMEHGRIVEQGTHDELVAAGSRYAELWEAWNV